MPRDKREGTFLLSSVTDPYQGPERKYLLTRGILTVLAEERYPGIVRILTKSPLVVRDIDLLRRLPRADVGMTVTTTDDKISRWLEVRAPRSSHRLKALAALHEAGIPTFAFVGPLLPHFAERPDLLDQLFGRLVDVGVREVYIEHINLKQYIRERMNLVLRKSRRCERRMYGRAPKGIARRSTKSSPGYWASTASSFASRKSSTTTNSRRSTASDLLGAVCSA